MGDAMDWLSLVNQIGDGPFKLAMLFSLMYGIRELSKMRKSVENLNLGMAVYSQKVNDHGRRLSNLEKSKK